ncbi:hypothetical protein [Spiroplasma chrysopicola]|uniref:Uncharacterized protein n=1 Tax=Spiroplasma chrysopicola DF-1 TaxID=1276227 RepID=R4UI01_9MOLU|nr:hypothetical protein [Spiroplasma chrysopicola]AGM24946.1 hypothetical protein SCHRY_v1c03630 [Spiroplasma chrysopicola DF-1]
MKKKFLQILYKIKLSFGLFTPKSTSQVLWNIFNNNDYEQAFIIINEINENNAIINNNETVVIEKNEQEIFLAPIAKKISSQQQNNFLTSPLLVILGFVLWFFLIKVVQLPPVKSIN